MLPVILGGGVGSRLWPISHAELPKQFSQLPGLERSLFQSTALRLSCLPKCLDPLVVCNTRHLSAVSQQLQQIHLCASAIFLEPFGKNTAPAAALGAFHAVALHGDPIVLILPCDQLIENQPEFIAAVDSAAELAAAGRLVMFGIVPDVPNTEFGYIECGAALPQHTARQVQSFVEKPALDAAKNYLASGRYLFNSGMFMFRASVYLEQLKQHAPSIYAACQAISRQMAVDNGIAAIPAAAFANCPSRSIDHAVMEKTQNAVVVPLDAGWSDLGSFKVLWEIQSKDSNGNASAGAVLLHGVTNSFVHSETRRVVAVGLKDTLVVETAQGILVADAHRLNEAAVVIRDLDAGARLNAAAAADFSVAAAECAGSGSDRSYQIKHLHVAPGGMLARQLPVFTASQCVVISGSGSIRLGLGQKTMAVAQGDCFFIAAQAAYEIFNSGEKPLEFIEIHTGDNPEATSSIEKP